MSAYATLAERCSFNAPKAPGKQCENGFHYVDRGPDVIDRGISRKVETLTQLSEIEHRTSAEDERLADACVRLARIKVFERHREFPRLNPRLDAILRVYVKQLSESRSGPHQGVLVGADEVKSALPREPDVI